MCVGRVVLSASVPLLLSEHAAGSKITSVDASHTAGKLRLHGDKRLDARHCFDLVVLAQGMSHIQVSPQVAHSVAVLGDAQWARQRWWDLGLARLRRGADTALCDAIELAALVSAQPASIVQSSGLRNSKFRFVDRTRRLRKGMLVMLCLLAFLWFYKS